MAEDLPFASASDVTERGGGFTLVRGTAFRDDGRNESAVVQVHTAVFRLPVYTDSIQHIQQTHRFLEIVAGVDGGGSLVELRCLCLNRSPCNLEM